VTGQKVNFVARWQVRGGYVPILVHWGVNRHTVDKSGGLSVIITSFFFPNTSNRSSCNGNHECEWPDSGSFYQYKDSGGECGVLAETMFYVLVGNKVKFLLEKKFKFW